MDMDEEKFSLERFLELMGGAPRGDLDRSTSPNSDRFREAKSRAILHAREGKSSARTVATNGLRSDLPSRGFHVEQSTWTDVREPETIEGRAEVAEKDETNTEKPRDGRRDVLRTRALKADELPQEVEAKPKRAGLLGRVVGTVRRAFGWETGAVAERGENAERAGDAVFENAEQVGARVEREWHEDEVPRARERVWREEEVESTGRARNRRWTEDGLSDEREGRAKRVWGKTRDFAESNGVLTESRGKIAEFRKSDAGFGIDLRAISRAIERDSRRY